MHTISIYRGNRPTKTNTPSRQGRLQYTAAASPARSVIIICLSTLLAFSRWTWVSRYRNILDFIGTKGDGGGGDDWSYKTYCQILSNHHHQQTNTQLLTGQMPFLSPNQQCQSTEWKMSHSMDLFTPSSPGVL